MISMDSEKLPFEKQCPSEYPCPFKLFSLKGMECIREKHLHLIVNCLLKEGKHFMSKEDFAKLEQKVGDSAK